MVAIDDPLVGVQRARDQLLADVRAVGVGGVDEVDTQLDRAPQQRDRAVLVGAAGPRSPGR